MTPFDAWDSTTLKLQCHLEGAVYLLCTTKFPEISDVHFKGWVDLGANPWFWAWDLWLENQRLNH